MITPRTNCKSQELRLTRLAMGIVEREDDDVTTEKLDKALVELFGKKVRDRRVCRGGGEAIAAV